MSRFLSFLAVVLLFSGCASPQEPVVDIPIIPMPVSMESRSGSFDLATSSGFKVDSPELIGVTERFAATLALPMGMTLPISEDGDMVLTLDASLEKEAYTIDVSEDALVISAGNAAGAFYAFQSILQMLPPEIEVRGRVEQGDWTIPAVHIEDAPRFSYRGMHLDVGRYFFDVAFIKKYIDTMARYKFNTFHWGLTQDQGWRLEIPAYPRLTEVGAWRKETIVDKNFDPYVGDGIPHGGFYTHDDVREVLAYAAERYVTVIPEINMPGHSTAALAAYPELGCGFGPYEVQTTWGIKSDILCPSETTFSFLTDVLGVVIDLFPSAYIHIGSDEVPKTQWENSSLAQSIMTREGLANEEELQSWFVRRIETFLNENDRNLIGWDEILEGGLAPNATVMSWRGMVGGIEAAKMGHDVIMTPTRYAYFDFYQADPESEPLAMNWAGYSTPLDTVYAFEPVPSELTQEEAQHILGAQGNVWTEYISTPEYAEYMVYPRAMALAEVVWSPPARRNLDSFYRRLVGNLPHLESLGVNYRIPDRLARAEEEIAALN
ncbi:MAG: beta-N-acetylhexosaminidase [Bacteroidetes Order II. Incertae sedis bacterium]|nr:beta-N-acetylhexosaminidase [Bacteroidetes Order II. bacterium]